MFRKKGKEKTDYHFETPEERQHKLDMLVAKEIQKGETLKAIKHFVKAVTLTPICLFLRVIAWVSKIIATISILGIFVGIYDGWKYYQQYQSLSASSDYSLLKTAFFYCLLPFVLSLIHFGSEALGDKLEDIKDFTF